MQGRFIAALLLQGHIRNRQQHALLGDQAQPVEGEIAHTGVHGQAVDHLVGVQITGIADRRGVDLLGCRRQAGGPVYRVRRVEPWHVGQDEAGNQQGLLLPLLFCDQVFTRQRE
ncbi:hypothetical protein D9M70_603620 [compost metagenome]